ncbi:hypothetical protein A3D77_07985 [Candidatus Gottesmanbacteria bacterium RIFCSPHIGHO2_02_FULL_39_11]|uniref:GHMP kinase N-terminal domain-containing protein n=1 Tax=Candidatus Gottesmanbacteria bacterium RIFCSPHIGHO2_02_FULL_39_11 TaxID=1798382 RepID=A0A1F5ZKI1_9BACT|nr:MAG: hypothetical protein A3D77_07985 [Candidatus Gottesmanbacteria bacterium RIFCSPHIGHO2_02_FULL_39_11]
MEKRVIFSIPAALSFIFKKIKNRATLKTGSVGVGCTINKKVKAVVEKSEKFCVFLNGKEISFPTVYDAVRSITNIPMTIYLTSSLPLGYGFGTSGASALASVFAVNKLLNLTIQNKKLIEYAHISEIKNGTGLGTVGTVSTGGFLIKSSAGIPFDYHTLPFTGKKLYAVLIDRLPTSSIIKNEQKLDKIEKAANISLEKIKNLKNVTLEEILDISYEFVSASSLISDTRVHDVIDKIRQRNGHATMAILGNVVITTQRPTFTVPYDIETLTITN